MAAGGYKYVPCALKRERAFDIRVIHVLGGGEGLQRPVDEAVEEDEAGAASPDHQDGDEGGAQIVDHLRAGARLQSFAHNSVEQQRRWDVTLMPGKVTAEEA